MPSPWNSCRLAPLKAPRRPRRCQAVHTPSRRSRSSSLSGRPARNQTQVSKGSTGRWMARERAGVEVEAEASRRAAARAANCGGGRGGEERRGGAVGGRGVRQRRPERGGAENACLPPVPLSATHLGPQLRPPRLVQVLRALQQLVHVLVQLRDGVEAHGGGRGRGARRAWWRRRGAEGRGAGGGGVEGGMPDCPSSGGEPVRQATWLGGQGAWWGHGASAWRW